MAVTIKNLDRLITKMNNLSDVDVENYVKKATTFVHGQAKNLAPVDSGHLRESIHMETKKEKNKVIGRVYTNTVYAPFVEFGTGIRGDGQYEYASELDFTLVYKQDWVGMSPQPFMYPALKGAETYVKKMISGGIQSEINKIAKGGR